MKFGASDVAAMKLGAADVSRVYLGASLVWEAGGAVFSPADLFASGEAGFWGQVQTSDLWQDVARTTPVTTAGDPVGSWRLYTSSGVIYATQSTSGSRPIYRLDGDVKPYLDFASSKWMVTPTITPGSDKAQFFSAYLSSAFGFKMLLETSAISDTNNGSIFMLVQGDGNQINRYRSRGTVSVEAQSPAITLINTKVFRTGLSDIAGDSVILRENGTQVASTGTDQGSGNYGAYPAYIGSRGGTTLYWNGRIYGLILRFGPNLTGDQITDAEAWISGLL